MGNRECEWVTARLPLWVNNGDSDNSTDVLGEHGDLSMAEHRQIERHLAGCATCRQHQVALDQALGVLEIAANHLPVIADAPSLWPVVEQRIVEGDLSRQRQSRAIPAWLSTRSVRPWANLNSEQPIRQAWTHDTLRELLPGAKLHRPEFRRIAGLLLKSSAAAAAVLIALSGRWMAHREWIDAQATIVANRSPLGDPLPPPTVVDEPSSEVADGTRSDVPTNQLADAEPSRTLETTASGAEATVPKPSLHMRFGFDLEHGIPMPPDTREAKPVY